MLFLWQDRFSNRFLIFTYFLVLIFLLFIQFSGVTTGNKIIQDSGAQFHKGILYTILCVHCSKLRLLPSLFIPPHPPEPAPVPSPGNHQTVVHEFSLFSSIFPPPDYPSPTPIAVSMLPMRGFVSILLIHFIH